MIRSILRTAHDQVPDLVKFLGSIGYTFLAALTASQEEIAWAAQVFMWLTAGLLSVITAVSVIIKTIRSGRDEE